MLAGIPLVDAHVHAGRLSSLKMGFDRWTAASRDREAIKVLYDDAGGLVAERFDAYLEAQGVDCALLFPEYSPRVTGIQAIEDMLPYVEHNPNRFRVLANVNPHLHFPAAKEVERQLDLGAVALKVHPCHGNFPANTRELYPVYALCAERGVPVVFHCGTSNFPGARNLYAGPELMEDVAKDFPELTIVLAHGGRGWWYDAVAFLSQLRENVWIELSGLPPKRLREYYARFDLARLAQKFIFGSDWPGVPGIRANAEAIIALGWPHETLERVFWRNASEVYGIGDLG
jgi:predicted TIM-barrel fold metal-dependent hydrolase